MAARGVKKVFQQVNRVNDVLLPQFENLKQRKLGRSAYNVFVDYKAVFVDFAKGVIKKPLKSATCFAGLGGVYGTYRFNPDERVYVDLMLSNANDLLQVSKTIRNPVSDTYTQDILKLYYEGRLKRQSFLLFSVMLVEDFSRHSDSYEKHCYYTKPRWIYLWKQVIDVGILGHWVNLEKSMDNYDINSQELIAFPDDDEQEGSAVVNKAKKIASSLMVFADDCMYSVKQSFENLTS